MGIDGKFNRAILSVIIVIVLVIIFGFSVCHFYSISMQKVAVTKLKNIYAELIQASRISSMVHNEDMGNFKTDMPINLFAEKYFTPYLRIDMYCKGSQDSCWNSPQYKDLKGSSYFNKSLYSVILTDGSVVGFNKDKNDIVTLIVDVNGKVKPNILGQDVFVFSIYNTEHHPDLCKTLEYDKFLTYSGIHLGGVDKCGIPHDAHPYSDLISEDFEDGCNKKSIQSENGFGVGSACLAVLKQNAWVVDKNYPW